MTAAILLLLLGRSIQTGLIVASDFGLTRSRLTGVDLEPVSGLSDVSLTRSSLSEVDLT